MPRLTIRFEDMKYDIEKNIKKILNFIDYKNVSSVQLKKAIEESKITILRNKSELGERFFRKGESHVYYKKYSKKQIKYILNILKPLLLEYDYFEEISTEFDTAAK